MSKKKNTVVPKATPTKEVVVNSSSQINTNSSKLQVKIEDAAILSYGKQRIKNGEKDEFAFMVAYVFKADEKVIEIKDLEPIIEDEATSVTVTVDAEEMARSIGNLSQRINDDNVMYAHGHSHCFMATSPSGMDSRTAEKLLNLSNGNEVIMFIINDAFEITVYTAAKILRGFSTSTAYEKLKNVDYVEKKVTTVLYSQQGVIDRLNIKYYEDEEDWYRQQDLHGRTGGYNYFDY